jgi:hypothetical protein
MNWCRRPDRVGVTHECNYQSNAKTKPTVVNCTFGSDEMRSKQIEQKR